MQDKVERIVRSQLSGYERLLWVGQPRQGIIFRLSDIFVIPFLLVWVAFAGIWEIAAFESNRPVFLKLCGIPFVLFGFFLVVWRFFNDARQRKKTYYGVTNERIIIISGSFSQKTKSLALRTLSDIILEEKPNGVGIISFAPLNSNIWGSNNSFGIGGSRRPEPLRFERIKQAGNVYEIIRNAQK